VLLRWLLAGLAGWGLWPRSEKAWLATCYGLLVVTLLVSGAAIWLALRVFI
jgi:hypothetical protein